MDDVFKKEVVFGKMVPLMDPQASKENAVAVGWWILFGLRSMPGMWAGSLTAFSSRMDPPYGFGECRETELVYVRSGVLRIGSRTLAHQKAEVLTPGVILDLRVSCDTGSGELESYTLWQTNFFALWERLLSRGLSEKTIAQEIAGGLTCILKGSRDMDSLECTQMYLHGTLAFEKLMERLKKRLTPLQNRTLLRAFSE